MFDVIAAEWEKFRSLRSNGWLLLASLLAVGLSAGVTAMVVRGYDNQTPDERLSFSSVGDGLSTGLPVAYFVLAALGALSVSSEHATGMIRTSLVAVPRRGLLLFAKAPVVAGIGLAAGLALAFGMHAAAMAVLGGRADDRLLDGTTLGTTLSQPGVLPGLLVAGAAGAAAALVGLGVGALVRSTAGALVTLIVILFVLPGAAQVLPRPLGPRVGSFMFENLPEQIAHPHPEGVLGPIAALALLIAYPVVALTGGAAAIALRGRRFRPLAVGLAATVLLALVPALPSSASTSALTWSKCRGEVECATLAVPVDWARPQGRKITIRLGRLPATGTHRRLGVVFSIPGGPGGSGIGDLEKHGASFAELRRHFDVVSFAPRNVTDDGPDRPRAFSLDCLKTGPWIELPDDRAEFAALGERNRAAAEQCRRADPEYFDNLDSASVARDIEAVRAALGEARLSFVATSYGTVPAAAYARLFPGRVRAMYVDGGDGGRPEGEAEQRVRYASIERQFARFAAWCRATTTCALHGRDVVRVWQDLVASADRSPVPVRGRGVAYSGFDFKVAAAPSVVSPGPMPQAPRWHELAAAIAKAAAGDAAGFASYVEAVTGSPKPMSFRGMNMTHCQDGLSVGGYEGYRRLRALGEKVSPNFAGNELWHPLACVGWPAPVKNPPAAPPSRGLPPMVAAGSWTDHDDTAYLVRNVPGSSTIRYDGSGHGLYLSGERCTIAHANRYLLTLTPPAPGTTCAPPAPKP
ncbi:alpha/beta fold hydrolase [Bailinhaonella thermotolerans]|uniref:Alpha/beta fold hydrolase n=1 Tax=Bailinhaonella thermotolerans TaxID=1070861 RepID=A0A3A4B8I9_9ACTN|nr:alpha/beta fold hydrolase [Bailinhaonella thermotolerans]